MRKMLTALAALVVAVGFGSLRAGASPTGTFGCGGAGQVACSGSWSLTDGVYTGSATVQVTGYTGISSSFLSANPYVAGVLGGSPLTLSFNTNGAGTIIIGNIVDGVGDFELDAGITKFTAGTDSLSFAFSVFAASLNLGTDSCGASCAPDFFDNLTGINGTLTVNFTPDPAITSVSGSVGLPFGTGGATPEPGTLLLLGSGLVALGFIGRKLVVCG